MAAMRPNGETAVYWWSGKPLIPAGWAEEALSPREQGAFASLKFAKKRQDWLNGRWAIRTLLDRIGDRMGLIELSQSEILTGAKGEPRLHSRVTGEMENLQISLAHSEGRAACAAAFGGGGLGIDLELIRPRKLEAFRRFFAPEDVAWLGGLPDGLRDAWLTLLWTVREARYKARQGAVDLNETVRLLRHQVGWAGPGTWDKLRVVSDSEGERDVFWRQEDDFLLAIWLDDPSEPRFVFCDLLQPPAQAAKGCSGR